MAIKNKDGSVYRLKGPNPIMQGQEVWTDFVTHNMKWAAEIQESELLPAPKITHEKTFFEELVETKEILPKEESQEIAVAAESPTENLPKTIIHCLPAIIKSRKDNLYDEEYKTIQYGQPFEFEAISVQEEDLFIQLWTNATKVGQGAILYPKVGLKRWWRVQEVAEKDGGSLLTALPSDYHPAFG